MKQTALFPLPAGAPPAAGLPVRRAIEQISQAVSLTDSRDELVTITLPRYQLEAVATAAIAGDHPEQS